MAEMDIGFGPGKFNPDLNTQMGGVDPFLQKAARIKSPEEGIGVAVELAGEERRLGERETAAKIKKEKALPEIEATYRAEEGRLVKEARTREQDMMAEAERAMSNFTVSKETLGGMATLASVIGVLGSLAGNTGGKRKPTACNSTPSNNPFASTSFANAHKLNWGQVNWGQINIVLRQRHRTVRLQ